MLETFTPRQLVMLNHLLETAFEEGTLKLESRNHFADPDVEHWSLSAHILGVSVTLSVCDIKEN